MNENLTDHQLDQIFDNEKLDQAIRKSKRKSTRKTILISLLVAVLAIIILSAGNFALTTVMGINAYYKREADVKLTVPNGYISKSLVTYGLLGGRADDTLCRLLNGKFIILSNQVRLFGIIPQPGMSWQKGSGMHIGGQWPTSYWEYGYNRMFFFHPDITYKAYKNDLADIGQIPDDKLIELGLSFDKPYTIAEVFEILPDTPVNWFWVDAYRSQDMEQYRDEAEANDAKSAYISEYDAPGVSMGFHPGNPPAMGHFVSQYSDFLNALNASKNPKYLEIYEELKNNGYADAAKVPILGVIAYGTKDQLEPLVSNPYIKASSFGVIVDKY